MQKIAFIVLFILFAGVSAACVNLTDPTTYGGDVTNISNSTYFINNNLTLCTGTYTTNTIHNFLIINGSHTLDCNGSTLIGSGLGKAVLSTHNGTVLKNCTFEGFGLGLNVLSFDEISTPNVLWNWTQNSYTWIYSVAVDQEGNIIAGGYEGSVGNSQLAVVKINPDGNKLWDWTQKPSPITNEIKSIATDQEGNIIAGGINVSMVGNQWRVVKIDPNGNTIWNWTQTPTSNSNSLYSVTVDQEGNIIAGGFDDSPGNNQWRVVKIDPNGNTLWNWTQNPSSDDDIVNSVVVDQYGNIIIAGYYVNFAKTQWRVVKIDPNGNTLWNWTPVYTAYNNQLKSVAIDREGNIIAGGLDNSPGNSQWKVMKIDSNGNTVWSWTQNPSNSGDLLNSVAVDQEGNIIAGGYDYSTGNSQWRIVKIDLSSNTLWNWTQDPSTDDRLNSISVDQKGNIIAGGTDYSPGNYQWRVVRINQKKKNLSNLIFQDIKIFNENASTLLSLLNSTGTFSNIEVGYNSSIGKVLFSYLSNGTNYLSTEYSVFSTEFVSINVNKTINDSANITIDSGLGRCLGLEFYKLAGFPQNKTDIITNGASYTPSYVSCSNGIVTFSTLNGFSGYAVGSSGNINISLTKTDSPDPLNISQSTLLNYTILINVTNGTAYNITLNETYPNNTTFVSSIPAPTVQNYSWTIGNLTAGQTYQINITINVSPSLPNGTTLTNNATINYANATGNQFILNVSESTKVIKTEYVPEITFIILNATSQNNYTTDNITVHYNSTDAGGDKVINITDWKENATSIGIVNMPFEGGSNNTFTRDYTTYQNNGSVTTAIWYDDKGVDGTGAYWFDGAGDSISIPDDPSLDITRNITVSVWVKPNETDSSYDRVVVRAWQTNVAPWNVYGLIRIANTQTYSFDVGFTDQTSAGAITTNQLTLGQWTHLVGVYDGSEVRIYVNGTEQASTPASKTIQTNSMPITIGKNPHASGEDFKGYIDEVRVYDRVLSDEEIQLLYEQNYDMIPSTGTQSGDVWQACVTPNDGKQDGVTNCSNSITIQDEPNAPPIVTNVTLTATSASNLTEDNLSLNYNVSDPENLSVTNITDWEVNNRSIAIANLPFENNQNASTTAKDYSTYGQDFIVDNAVFKPNGGQDGFGAYDFDGTTSKLNGSNTISNYLDEEITVMAWVYPRTGTGIRRGIITERYSAGNPTVQFELSIGDDTVDGRLTAGFYDGGWNDVQDSSNIPTNQWVHVAATYDGHFIRIYKNATQVAVSADFNTALPTGTTGWFIGKRHDNFAPNHHFNGLIDDARIYNRSLSQEQIQAIFNGQNGKMVSNETSDGEVWKACVTANDGTQDGDTNCSNNIAINSPGINFGDTVSATVNLTYNLSGNGTGLYIVANNIVIDCKGHSIIGNGSASGLKINGSNVTIQNCIISNFYNGVNADPGIGLIVNSSAFSNSANCTVLNAYNNSFVWNNTYYNCTENAIVLINGSYNNQIYRNLINRSGVGVNLLSGTNNTVYNNTFINSSIAHANSIAGNNFNNTLIGNSWDDILLLDIVDTNGDGIGDTGTEYPYNNTNGANVTGSVNDYKPLTNKTTGTLNISLTKTDSPDPLNISQSTLLNYTILINVTNGTAYNITLNETYPNNTTFVTSNPAPTVQNHSWNIGNLTKGQTYQINITINVSPSLPNGTTLTNNATINYANATGNQFSLTVLENTTIINASGPSGNVSIIYNCTNLNLTGHTYVLNQSITNYNAGNCMIFSNHSITLDCNGNTIDGIGTDYGIFVNETAYNRIINCHVNDFDYGIYAFRSNFLSIINSTANDSTSGIRIYQSRNASLESVNATYSNSGIYLDKPYGTFQGTNIKATNNIAIGMILVNQEAGDIVNVSEFNFSNNGGGIGNDAGFHTNDCSALGNIYLSNGHMDNNDQYGYLARDGAANPHAYIRNVSFVGNQYGIKYYYMDDGLIQECVIQHNADYGIHFDTDVDNIEVTRNIISENIDRDIYITQTSTDNNKFWNNTLQVNLMVEDYSASTQWNNSLMGNTWLNFDSDDEGCFNDTNDFCNVSYSVAGTGGGIDELPVYVGVNGSIKTLDCNNCSSCQELIDNWNHTFGDTINLTADIGNHPNTCIDLKDHNGIIFECNNNLIDGVGVGYGITSHTYGVSGSDYSTIQNCNINQFQYGLYFTVSENITFENNSMNGNNRGLSTWSTRYLTIQNISAINGATGIYMEYPRVLTKIDGVTIKQNTDIGIAALYMNSGEVLNITNSNISSNGNGGGNDAGMYVYGNNKDAKIYISDGYMNNNDQSGYFARLGSSNPDAYITNVTFIGNDVGIRYYYMDDGLVEDCTIQNNNVYGLSLDNFAQNIDVYNNLITQNTLQDIYTSGTSSNSLLWNNTLENNTNISANGLASWNITTGGNHWLSFDEPFEGCFDLNRDGICDNANITINANNIDYLPLYDGPTINCGDIINSNFTMPYGLDCNGSALKITGNNMVFDCANNHIKGNGSGIGIKVNGSNVNITNCNISNFEIDLEADPGVGLIVNNTAFANAVNCTVLNAYNNSFLSNNTYYNCTENAIVLINGSYNNQIYQNLINRIGVGVNLLSGTNNTVYNNTFINSSIAHANSIAGNYFNNTIIGNNWDDILSLYIFDTNGDGLGDIGSQYPYNSTNNANVTGSVNDYKPITNKGLGSFSVNILSPANGSVQNTTTINGTCYANGSDIINNLTFIIYRSDGTVNATYSINPASTTAQHTWIIPWTNGNYSAECNATNLAGQSNVSNRSHFILDNTAPQISFEIPTTTNGIHSQNWIYANVSVNDTTRVNTTVYIYTEAGVLVNSSKGTNSMNVNFTGLNDGNYKLNATGIDLAGNSNKTETRNITLETRGPQITLISPANGLATTQTSIQFVYSFTDASLTNCSLTVDNVTVANSTNLTSGQHTFTYNLAIGPHTWNITCVDALGNTNTSNETRSITIRRPSTGGTGGGGGGGGASSAVYGQTYQMTGNSQNFNLNMGDKVQFNIGTELHSLFVNNVFANTVQITTASIAKTYTLAIGTNTPLDVTGDNIADILVDVNYVNRGQVNIKISKTGVQQSFGFGGFENIGVSEEEPIEHVVEKPQQEMPKKNVEIDKKVEFVRTPEIDAKIENPNVKIQTLVAGIVLIVMSIVLLFLLWPHKKH